MTLGPPTWPEVVILIAVFYLFSRFLCWLGRRSNGPTYRQPPGPPVNPVPPSKREVPR